MAAIANLTINDAQTTPVAHTFEHKSHSATELAVVDGTDGLTNLARVTITVAKLPSKDRNVRKLRTRVVLPVLEVVSGNTALGYVAEPKKVGESVIVTDCLLHNRTSEQGLKDLLSFHRGFSNSTNAMFMDPYLYDQANY